MLDGRRCYSCPIPLAVGSELQEAPLSRSWRKGINSRKELFGLNVEQLVGRVGMRSSLVGHWNTRCEVETRRGGGDLQRL